MGCRNAYKCKRAMMAQRLRVHESTYDTLLRNDVYIQSAGTSAWNLDHVKLAFEGYRTQLRYTPVRNLGFRVQNTIPFFPQNKRTPCLTDPRP